MVVVNDPVIPAILVATSLVTDFYLTNWWKTQEMNGGRLLYTASVFSTESLSVGDGFNGSQVSRLKAPTNQF